MVRVGLVGVGFMGWIHYLAYQRSSSAQLVAFASRDSAKRQGDWKSIRGNFGPTGEQIDVSKMRAYETLDQMLEDPSIDVIDICLPPHMHADTAIAALERGKHVLCEKPLALKSTECDRILAAAEKSQRMVMVAHVLPYIGPFAYAARLAKTGEYGKVLGGYFKRTISNPDWIPDFFDATRVGGPLIDLNVHDAHFVRMVFGVPKQVTAVGRVVKESVTSTGNVTSPVTKFAHVIYEFSDPEITVASTGGVTDTPGRGFTHGFELNFERATLQFEFSAFADICETMPLKVLLQSGEVLRPTLPNSDDITAFELEISDMVTSIESGDVAERLSSLVARDAIHLAECIQRSVIERRSIQV
ncbi:MAG: Gfo/Idh/MocA family oxidoreductase [Pirellulaceae bacterium]|nr:Gfo/Idh/MocA family oxidoreductase [Pirellulaceae bacterium]